MGFHPREPKVGPNRLPWDLIIALILLVLFAIAAMMPAGI
jgi:hypothetical protein